MKNLETNLKEFDLDLQTMPLVLQLNKRDLHNTLSVDDLYKVVNYKSEPYVEAVGTGGEGVVESLNLVTKMVLRKLRET